MKLRIEASRSSHSLNLPGSYGSNKIDTSAFQLDESTSKIFIIHAPSVPGLDETIGMGLLFRANESW